MLDVVELWNCLYLRRQEQKIDSAWFYFTVVFMKLCFSSFPLLFFSFWLVPPTSCLPLPTTPFVETGVWGFQWRRRHKSHMSSWLETEQGRALFPPFSLSACLSLSLSLSLFPLWVSARQDPVSLQPASQPDSYVGEPDWLSTESDVKSCLPRSSLHGSQLGGCMLCCSLQCSLGDDWSNLLICLRGTVRFLLLWFCLKPSFQCGLQTLTEMIQ